MRLRSLTLMAVPVMLTLAGCPEKTKEIANEVGGAPKRQLDNVQKQVDQAVKIDDIQNKKAEDVEQ